MGRKRPCSYPFSSDRLSLLLEKNCGISWYEENEQNYAETSDSESSDSEFEEDIPDTMTVPSASARKILPKLRVIDSESDDEETSNATEKTPGNFIWGCEELQSCLNDNAVCFMCLTGKLFLHENTVYRHGWGTKVAWQCLNTDCPRSTEERLYSTSRMKNQCYEINRTLVLGMRAIGRGRSAASKLSTYLDVPTPVTDKPWRKHAKALGESATDCTEDSMDGAFLRLKRLKLGELHSAEDLDDEDYVRATVVDCAVSVDGSWMTRRYYSRHAFVSVISMDTGECLDRIYLCSSCRVCKQWEGRSRTCAEYLDFYQAHFVECPLNHDGSSQTMEPEGAERLFCQSLEKYGLRTQYIGDGDSKSFLQVKNAQPYGPGVDIVKEECIGHVQKRMGTRLRTLVNKKKGVKLSDGKGLQGKGRLTQKRIDSFQVFYGKALRANEGDLEGMCRSTMAILGHYSSTNDEPQDNNCSNGATSWCKWKRDVATGQETYRPPKHPLSPAVVEAIEPVFKELSSPDLLRACFNGNTQNTNECLHHMIWALVPKEQSHSSVEVQLGIDLAVMNFNDEMAATNKAVFEANGLTLSKRSVTQFIGLDERIYEATRQSSTLSKSKRKKRRQEKMKQLDAFEKADGPVYQSGGFHTGLNTLPKTIRSCRKCQKPMREHPRSRLSIVIV